MATEPVQPPIWSPPLSGRDAALVAGFLLHYRQGMLYAREFFELADPTIIPEWQDPMSKFWTHAEEITRYLLWWTGYRVGKGEMWPEDSSRDRP